MPLSRIERGDPCWIGIWLCLATDSRMPSTDNASTNPTVPIATDKHGAPLSLPRKQTDVTPVLNQFENRTVSTPR